MIRWVDDFRSGIFLLLLLAVALFLLGSTCHSNFWHEGVSAWQLQGDEPVVRLHVRAAGDSPAEQRFKMDLVLQVQQLLSAEKSPRNGDYAGYISFLKGYVPELERALQDYAAEIAAPQIFVQLKQEYFPLRTYGRRIFPAGEYTALTVTVGEGVGENWWCLLYPSLCLPPAKIMDKPLEKEEDEHILAVCPEPRESDACSKREKVKKTAGSGRWRIKVWEFIRRPGQQIIEKAGQIFYN